MRILSLALAWTLLCACALLPGRNDDSPMAVEVDTDADTDVDEELYLQDCDITCSTDGLDLSIDAYNAEEAEIEFYSAAVLVETFPLTQLDDQSWVGYPDWPAGYSFDDCGADADFVCVIRGLGQEIRESR